MMQVVPKWKVTATFAMREVVIFVSNARLGNVLQTLSTMDFSQNSLKTAVETHDRAETGLTWPELVAAVIAGDPGTEGCDQ